MMSTHTIPGVYFDWRQAARRLPFTTGVPAFLGYPGAGPTEVVPISSETRFVQTFGESPKSFMAAAVRGFFQNGGQHCFIVRLRDDVSPRDALDAGLTQLELVPEVDLVCLPDSMRDPDTGADLQQRLVNWCDAGNERFAILDPPPASTVAGVLARWRDLDGRNAGLYYPWLGVTQPGTSQLRTVPPCGHIAGIYAKADQTKGFYTAPANYALQGVLDVETVLTDGVQAAGDPFRVVNCIRVFPGRGIVLWGARTISGEAEWRYINVRRLFLTLHRWLDLAMSSLVYEPNTPALWARIRRTVGGYLDGLYRNGALAGATPAEAYFVHCDASTTPPYARENGQVIAEIGIAPVVPAEFIVVKILFGAGEVVIDAKPEQTGKENKDAIKR